MIYKINNTFIVFFIQYVQHKIFISKVIEKNRKSNYNFIFISAEINLITITCNRRYLQLQMTVNYLKE